MTVAIACAILDLGPDFTVEQLRNAYHEACRKWHPDNADRPDTTDRFVLAEMAYECLKLHVRDAGDADGGSTSSRRVDDRADEIVVAFRTFKNGKPIKEDKLVVYKANEVPNLYRNWLERSQRRLLLGRS
jgi:DnaJ domain